VGASDWHHVVPLRSSLIEVLDELHRQVIEAGTFYWPFRESPDDPLPTTLEEIRAEPDLEYSGTHSVLDVDRVIGSGEDDGFGTLRPLTAAEIIELVGTARPTRADFARAYGDGTGPLLNVAQRWSGYALPLYEGDAGTPAGIAIWGYSGD
jgi:hypothetical protein